MRVAASAPGTCGSRIANSSPPRRATVSLLRSTSRNLVQRLVLLLDRLAAQAVHQPAVLERDAGVVGKGLEDLGIVRVEGTEIAESVGDEHDSGNALVSAQRGNHSVANSVLR